MKNLADVFVTRKLPQHLMAKFERKGISYEMWTSEMSLHKADLEKQVVGRKGILCMLSDKMDKNIIDLAGPSLKTISTLSVGYNHVDLSTLKAKNIRLGYTPGILSDATAELAMALLLATSRRIVEANGEVHNGGWKSLSPFWMVGKGLLDATVGIVGLGSIGKQIAQRCAAFNPARILYSGSGRQTETVKLISTPEREINAEYREFSDLLAQSDFVIVSCLLNDSTRNMFNASTFSKMKPGSIFINVSRGEVVDQDALYEALTKQENGLLAAGLDVTVPEPIPTDHRLLGLKNCVILPHIGSATIETRSAMVEMAVDNLIAGLQDTEMRAEVKL